MLIYIEGNFENAANNMEKVQKLSGSEYVE